MIVWLSVCQYGWIFALFKLWVSNLLFPDIDLIRVTVKSPKRVLHHWWLRLFLVDNSTLLPLPVLVVLVLGVVVCFKGIDDGAAHWFDFVNAQFFSPTSLKLGLIICVVGFRTHHEIHAMILWTTLPRHDITSLSWPIMLWIIVLLSFLTHRVRCRLIDDLRQIEQILWRFLSIAC